MTGAADPWFAAMGPSGPVGLDDIGALLLDLPASLRAVVLIVLHRLWDKESRLRTILSRMSRMPVVIASQRERFQPGTAYIGEPAAHLIPAPRD